MVCRHGCERFGTEPAVQRPECRPSTRRRVPLAAAPAVPHLAGREEIPPAGELPAPSGGALRPSSRLGRAAGPGSADPRRSVEYSAVLYGAWCAGRTANTTHTDFARGNNRMESIRYPPSATGTPH
jgi:hypothetical protein